MLPVEAAIKNAQNELRAQADPKNCDKSAGKPHEDPSSAHKSSAIPMHSHLEDYARLMKSPSLPTKLWGSQFPELQLSDTDTITARKDESQSDYNTQDEKRKQIRSKLKIKLREELYDRLKSSHAK
jgi:hypothetical protein